MSLFACKRILKSIIVLEVSHMKKLLTLTAAIALVTGTANAATTIYLGATSSDTSFSAGGTLTPNVDLTSLSPSQLTLTGNAFVVNPATSVAGQYSQPLFSLYGDNFLAVVNSPGPAGTAVYNLNPGQHVFGFTWGTVDSFNNLVLTATNATYALSGTDLVNNIPSLTTGPDQADVIFNDTAGTILSATFTSGGNSFEVANFESAVPLPAALPLFGSALVGAGALARRRKA